MRIPRLIRWLMWMVAGMIGAEIRKQELTKDSKKNDAPADSL